VQKLLRICQFKDKKVGIITNQTGIITNVASDIWKENAKSVSIVDFLLSKKIAITLLLHGAWNHYFHRCQRTCY
jgi:hypothetical protein